MKSKSLNTIQLHEVVIIRCEVYQRMTKRGKVTLWSFNLNKAFSVHIIYTRYASTTVIVIVRKHLEILRCAVFGNFLVNNP